MIDLACRNEGRWTAERPQDEELRAAVKALFRKKGEIFLAPKKERPAEKKRSKKRVREAFLRSPEWIEMRKYVLRRDGRECVKCGSSDRPNVDHILPRSKAPDLALDELNLRVLCWPCNKIKAAQIELDIAL